MVKGWGQSGKFCFAGWAMQDIMQWATVYAMPLALGVAKTFSDEVDMVKEVDPIFYWWQPLELMGAANKKACDQPIGFAEPFQ